MHLSAHITNSRWQTHRQTHTTTVADTTTRPTNTTIFSFYLTKIYFLYITAGRLSRVSKDCKDKNIRVLLVGEIFIAGGRNFYRSLMLFLSPNKHCQTNNWYNEINLLNLTVQEENALNWDDKMLVNYCCYYCCFYYFWLSRIWPIYREIIPLQATFLQCLPKFLRRNFGDCWCIVS